MLDSGQASPRPEWIESFFTPEGEFSELTVSLFHYHQALSFVLWELDASAAQWLVRGAAYEQLSALVEALRADKQYEGRQLVSSEFRSFDRQTADLAVVTVRETWQDRLYEFKEYPAGFEDETVIAQRGPYTLDVTYTLERDEDGGWLVTGVVYGNEPPSW
jgi:hypothetical protein